MLLQGGNRLVISKISMLAIGWGLVQPMRVGLNPIEAQIKLRLSFNSGGVGRVVAKGHVDHLTRNQASLGAS